MLQFAAFMYLFVNKLITQFASDSFLEILFQAVILVLAINKMLYFVRIYESGLELLICVQLMIVELLPFTVSAVALLFALSKIYKVLHMGINDPNGLYK